MAFQPRIFDTILMDMITHVRANTTLTDFSVGSTIRTILEAAALEDDEQYHQMVMQLKAFRISTATGLELDERAADFNVTRLPSIASISKIKFRDGGLTKDVLKYDTSSGAGSIELDDSSEFPTGGFKIRIGEGTANVEDIDVTSNNITTNIFTLDTNTTKNHSSGDRIAEVTGSDINVPSGVQVQVPSQGTESPILFEVIDNAVIVAGNYESSIVRVKATLPGISGNVGIGQISQFTSSPPFTGAQVTNTVAGTGGTDRETDKKLRARLKGKINVLGKGTPRAVEVGAIGTRDFDTGQQIIVANLIEDFNTNEHTLYIDDGTGFTPTTVAMASSQINGAFGIGDSVIPLVSTEDFPSSGYIIVSPENSAQVEIFEYTSKTNTTLDLSSSAGEDHDVDDEVLLIDKLPLAEEGQNYFQLSNYPIKTNSYQIWHNGSGEYVLQVEGTHYFLNRTNGQIQFYGTGLPKDTQVVSNFSYRTGIFATVQRIINGDKQNTSLYPGIVSAGVIINVDSPAIREVSITLNISVETGQNEIELRSQVRQVVETYVTELLIGQNVILAAIIERVMGTVGVDNVKIISPESDIVILENELPRPYDTLGSSLITVL